MAPQLAGVQSVDRRVFCSVCAAALASMACGGGSGGTAAAPAPPPDPVVNTGQTKAGLALDAPLGFSLGGNCGGAGFFLVRDADGTLSVDTSHGVAATVRL